MLKSHPRLPIRLIRKFCNLNYSHVSRLDANLFNRPCGSGEIRTPEDRSHLIYSQAVLTTYLPTQCLSGRLWNRTTSEYTDETNQQFAPITIRVSLPLFEEEVGFEPTPRFINELTIFKTVLLSHLSTPPKYLLLVSPTGLEPVTLALKVRYSTN